MFTPEREAVVALWALYMLLQLVRKAVDLPPEVRLWAARGIAAVLEDPNLSLDVALGLKPKSGPRQLVSQRKRFLVRKVGRAILGSKAKRAEQIAAVLRGEVEPPDYLALDALTQLRELGRFPQSTRRVMDYLED